MQKMIVASHNQGKITEIKTILKNTDLKILSCEEAGIWEQFPAEKKASYAENATIKARFLKRFTSENVLGDDAGMSLAAYPDIMGVTTARFLGEGISATEQNQKIIALLKDKKNQGREAVMHCVLCFIDEKGQEKTFSETCRGLITTEEIGNQGYGFDKIFYLPAFDKTLAELTDEERSQVSHRGKALHALAKWLVIEKGMGGS